MVLKNVGIERQRLRDNLAIHQLAGRDDLHLRQRRRGVEDPERRVVEVAAGDEELVRLVDARQRVRRRLQQRQVRIALANRLEPRAQVGDRVVVREQHAALGEKGVHERLVDGAFGQLPELRPLHQHRVHVHAVGIEGHVRADRRACRPP